MEANLKTLDFAERKKSYDEVQAILSEQVPMIYTVSPYRMPRSALIGKCPSHRPELLPRHLERRGTFFQEEVTAGACGNSAGVPFNNSFLQRIHCPALAAHRPLAFHVETNLPFAPVRFPDVQDEVGIRRASKCRLNRLYASICASCSRVTAKSPLSP